MVGQRIQFLGHPDTMAWTFAPQEREVKSKANSQVLLRICVACLEHVPCKWIHQEQL